MKEKLSIPSMEVKINNEWGELKSAVVHDASDAVDIPDPQGFFSKLNPNSYRVHLETGSVVKELLIEQHDKFRELLAKSGVHIVPSRNEPDGFTKMFMRDPAFVVGNTLYIGSMKERYRKCETDGFSAVRWAVSNVVDLRGVNGAVEGGDVMVLKDNLVLVGTGHTTDEAGYGNLQSDLNGKGINVVSVHHSALHLDCCFAPLPSGDALFLREKLPRASLEVLGKYVKNLIPINEHEGLRHLAANLLWLNPGEVISTAGAGNTNSLLQRMGYRVHEFLYDQIIHMWGSVRCTVCPLVRGDV